MPDERDDSGIPVVDPGEEMEIEFVDVDTGEITAGGQVPAEEPDATEQQDSELRDELERMREMYLRKLAEFDNYRKRTDKEREEFQQVAAEGIVRELLPIIDNFDRALLHADEADPKVFLEGIEMIARQMWELLQREGLEPIDPAGALFDPELHEAVQRVEESEHEEGTVVSVFSKGYTFGGRLMRPAMVAVATEPVATDETYRSETVKDVDEGDGS
jgi:molecular chaperone GrpE